MRETKIQILAIVGLFMAVSACTTQPTSFPGENASATSATKTPHTTSLFDGAQVALLSCPFGGREKEALGGTLLTATIAKGVDRIGAALTAAVKADTAKILAERNVELSERAFSAGACIAVARGQFSRNPIPSGGSLMQSKAFEDAEAALSPNAGMNDQWLATLWQNGLWLHGEPDFLFVGQILPESGTANAYTIHPLYSYFGEPSQSRFLRPGGAREIAVFFGFEDTGSNLNVEQKPGASLILGSMRPGEEVLWAQPNALPLGMGMTFVDGRAVPWNRSPFESDWFELALGEGLKPFRLKALVTETQGESAFVGFVEEIFAGSKQAIAKELDSSLNPSTRAKEDEEEESAVLTAKTNLDGKQAAAISALQKCAEGDKDYATLAASARKAMRELDVARAALGMPSLFSASNYSAIPVSTASDQIKAGCQQMLDKPALGG